MTRQPKFRLTVLLIALAIQYAGVVPPSHPAHTDAATTSPNFVIILLDDLDAAAVAVMPHVNALVRDQGTSFTNFFVTTPQCCPSRASILRGQYAHNHGVLSNGGPDGGFQAFYAANREASTLATWLQDQGYYNAFFGKYLNDYPAGAARAYVPPGWNEWHALSTGRYVKYWLYQNGRRVRRGERPRDYVTDLLGRRAIAAVRQANAASVPFLLYVAPPAPHEPARPAPRHRDVFAGATAPRPPSFNEADVTDKPSYVSGQAELTVDQISQIDRLYSKRLDTLLAVDEMVADLVAEADAADLLADTYFFFTSDNGYMLGQHRRVGKGAPYEEAIRVPLLVRGPGVAAGATMSALTANVDLAPTIAELAGAAPPNFVDGRSLRPLLLGESPTLGRQSILIEFFGAAQSAASMRRGKLLESAIATTPYAAIRANNLIYVEYDTGEREWYDLANDPYQLDNRAASADSSLISSLSDRLADLRACEAATCQVAEDALVPTL